jgi:hypothetical protein
LQLQLENAKIKTKIEILQTKVNEQTEQLKAVENKIHEYDGIEKKLTKIKHQKIPELEKNFAQCEMDKLNAEENTKSRV